MFFISFQKLLGHVVQLALVMRQSKTPALFVWTPQSLQLAVLFHVRSGWEMAVYPTCPKTIRKGRLPRKALQFSLDTDLLWSHRWYSCLSFSQQLCLAGVASLCFELCFASVVIIVNVDDAFSRLTVRHVLAITWIHHFYSDTWELLYPAVMWRIEMFLLHGVLSHPSTGIHGLVWVHNFTGEVRGHI